MDRLGRAAVQVLLQVRVAVGIPVAGLVRGVGRIQAVVEEAVATPAQQDIRELNVGAYCVSGDWLWDALSQIPVSPVGEYYLTDCPKILKSSGRTVLAAPKLDINEAMGVNTQEQLADVERVSEGRLRALAQLENRDVDGPDVAPGP